MGEEIKEKRGNEGETGGWMDKQSKEEGLRLAQECVQTLLGRNKDMKQC